MNKNALFLVLLVSLALFAGAVSAQDDSGWDGSGYSDYPYSSSGCCCGPVFVMVAGAAAFTYAYKKE
jgi:hypothetical protein